MGSSILYKKCEGDLLTVAPKAMQTQVVRQAHERGRFGVTKTEAIVKRDFWYKKLREDAEKNLLFFFSDGCNLRKESKQLQ